MSRMSTSSGVVGRDEDGVELVDERFCCDHEGGASTSARPSTSKALNLLRSSADALAFLFIEGSGNEELEDKPPLSLGGRLSDGSEDCELVDCILVDVEDALAAGVGGTARRPTRKPSGRAVFMPPSGNNFAHGCGSESFEPAADEF